LTQNGQFHVEASSRHILRQDRYASDMLDTGGLVKARAVAHMVDDGGRLMKKGDWSKNLFVPASRIYVISTDLNQPSFILEISELNFHEGTARMKRVPFEPEKRWTSKVTLALEQRVMIDEDLIMRVHVVDADQVFVVFYSAKDGRIYDGQGINISPGEYHDFYSRITGMSHTLLAHSMEPNRTITFSFASLRLLGRVALWKRMEPGVDDPLQRTESLRAMPKGNQNLHLHPNRPSTNSKTT